MNDRWSFDPWHTATLALFTIAPTAALWRIANAAMFWVLFASWLGVSAITYVAYSFDKQHAKAKGRREPERTLHLLELIGGWPGALVAQVRLRHKSSKFSYQFIFWLIIALHEFVAIDYLRGWPVLRQIRVATSHSLLGRANRLGEPRPIDTLRISSLSMRLGGTPRPTDLRPTEREAGLKMLDRPLLSSD